MRLILTLAAFSLVGKIMAEPAPPSAEEIIKKAIEARGGKEVMKRNAAVHIVCEGFGVLDDGKKVPTKVERWNAPPDRQRTVFNLMEAEGTRTTIVVLNKDQAWIKHDNQATELVDADQLRQLKAQVLESHAALLFPLLEDSEVTLTRVEDETRGGESCWCILVQRKKIAVTTLAFSKKTYLLRADRHSTQSDGLTETVYSDYRSGGLVAHKQETYVNSQILSSAEIKKVTPIEKIDEKLFSKPE